MTEDRVRSAFEADLLILPLASLLPVKQVTDVIRSSPKYKAIACSIDEIGVIEPLVVYRNPDECRRYLLLDGSLKRDILLAKGEAEAECLLATDDEAFTYNKRVCRLAIVQEHFMILRAIERGVSEQRIAKALDVDITHIKRRRLMLRGICPQAIDLLRDKSVNPVTFDMLRKMKPIRQAEACQLMVSASNYSSAFAKALLAATKDAERVRPARPAQPTVITSADLALMERELMDVQNSMKAVEASYGRHMLDLVIATRYVARLLANRKIARYLDDNHPEIAKEFERVASAVVPDSVHQPASRTKSSSREAPATRPS